jgi:uncharacterized paraquat-inducible protein A
MSEQLGAAARLLACPTCGLAQSVPRLPAGAGAHCHRCDALLARGSAGDGNQRAVCFALSALLLLVPAYG